MESTQSTSNPIKKVKVKTLTNQVYELEFDLSQPVSLFKQKIAEVSSVPVDRQRLVHMGKLLLDDQPLSNYVKGDDQTIHLMARTQSAANEPPPPPQAQTGPNQPNQAPQGNMPFNPFGINITGLTSSLGNLSDMIMGSINPNQMNQISNMANNLMRSFVVPLVPGNNPPRPPGQTPQQNPPQAAQQPTGSQQSSQQAQPGFQSSTQPSQQPPQPNSQQPNTAQQSQSSVPLQPIPIQLPPFISFQGGIPMRAPGAQQPHVHVHHHHGSQPIPAANSPIILPFNVLYTLGTMITQLSGENSIFPGPPLPQMGSRNNVQILGSYLSNWHFQMMRLLPYIYRLGEILQRQPALEQPQQREDTNNLIGRIAPTLAQVVNATQPVLGLYQNLRLGPNPSQFTLTPQLAPQVPSAPTAPQVIPPPPFLPQVASTGPPPQVNVNQMNQPTQVTFSAVIEEQIDGDQDQRPSATVIQQTTMTLPTGADGQAAQPQAFQLPFQLPFNILGLQFGVPQQSQPQPQAQPQPQSQPQPQAPPMVSPQPQSQTQQAPQPHSSSQQAGVGGSSSAQQMNNELQSTLRQNPGIASLLTPENISMATSSSVRDLLRDQDNPDAEQSIYSLIFGDIVANELMSSFTVQNFSYLDAKKTSIRKGLISALNRYAGSKEALAAKIVDDLKKITASEEMRASSMEGFDCEAVAADVLTKHILKWIALTLGDQPDYSQNTVKIGKTMLGELLYELSEGNQDGLRGVSQSLRVSIIRQYNTLMMGMAGLVFMLIERFILPLYNSYRADLERESQRTASDHLNEEQLIARISKTAAEDQSQIGEALKKPHSKHYNN